MLTAPTGFVFAAQCIATTATASKFPRCNGNQNKATLIAPKTLMGEQEVMLSVTNAPITPVSDEKVKMLMKQIKKMRPESKFSLFHHFS